MSVQSQHAVGTRPAHPLESADTAAWCALRHALIVAGARGAAPALTTAALMLYWRELQSTGATQRRWIVEELRAAVRRGETTARTWLAVALGETDPTLVREAVFGYLGGTPVSVERRERAADDTLEWIRRGLALNRAAVFVALLQLEDGAINERLTGLRGRMTAAETTAVWNACDAGAGTPSGDFIAEWRACA